LPVATISGALFANDGADLFYRVVEEELFFMGLIEMDA
jgi:hypothetical protein